MRQVELARHLTKALKCLDWSQVQLSRASGVSAAQISGMLGERRAMSRVQVNRVLFALLLEVRERWDDLTKEKRDELRPFRLHSDSLDEAVASFMSKAGFGPTMNLADPELDAFWRGLEPGFANELNDHGAPRTELTFAWFPYPPLAIPAEAATKMRAGTRQPHGLAIDICEHVAHLLGFTARYVEISVENIDGALMDNEAQVLAPVVLRHPCRMRSMCFSRPLPGLTIGFEALLPAAYADLRIGKVGREEWKYTFPVDYVITHPGGGTAFSLFHLQYPQHSYKHRRAQQGLTSWEFLLDDKKNYDPVQRRPYCFVTDQITALWAKSQNPERLRLGFEGKEAAKARLSLALAVSPTEPKLLEAIDQALLLAEKVDMFRDLYYERFKEPAESIYREVVDVNYLKEEVASDES